MSALLWRGTLIEFLRNASGGSAPDGWTYFARAPELFEGSSDLVVASHDEAGGTAAKASGFRHEGLDTATAISTVDWARSLESPPSDELMVSSFRYYLVNDAFLPSKNWKHGRAK